MVEGKCRRKKQCNNMVDRLLKWLKVRHVTNALKATRDRDAQEVMVTYAEEQGT